MWHSRWEWCRQGEKIPSTTHSCHRCLCSVAHQMGEKKLLWWHSPERGTSRATTPWNVWSSGIYRPTHEQLFQRAQEPSPREWRLHRRKNYNSRNPFYVSSKLSLARVQKWDLQLLSLGFILVSDAQNACQQHQGNKKKLTKFCLELTNFKQWQTSKSTAENFEFPTRC